MSKCCESFELFVDARCCISHVCISVARSHPHCFFSFCADGGSDKSSHCGQEAQNVESAPPGNPEIEDAEIKAKKDKKNREKEKKKGKSKIKEKKRKEENEDPEKKKKKGFGVMLRYGILQSKTVTHSHDKIGNNRCSPKVVEKLFHLDSNNVYVIEKESSLYFYTKLVTAAEDIWQTKCLFVPLKCIPICQKRFKVSGLKQACIVGKDLWGVFLSNTSPAPTLRPLPSLPLLICFLHKFWGEQDSLCYVCSC